MMQVFFMRLFEMVKFIVINDPSSTKYQKVFCKNVGIFCKINILINSYLGVC